MGNRRQNYGQAFGPSLRKPSRKKKTKLWNKCVKEKKRTEQFYKESLPDNTRVVVQTRGSVPSKYRSNTGTICSQKNIKESRPSSSRLDNGMISPQSYIEKPRSSSSMPDNVRASPPNNIENPRASSRGSNNRAVSLRKNTELSSRLNKAPTSSHKNIENPRPSSSSLDNGSLPMPRNTKVPRPSFPRPNNGMVSQPKDNEKSRRSQLRDGFSSGMEKLAFTGSKDGSNSKSNNSKKLHPSLMVRNSCNAGQMVSVHARKEDQVIRNHRRNLGDNSFPKIGKDLSTHQTVKAPSMGNNIELNAKSKRDDKFKRKRIEPLSEEELETPMMRTEPHEDHDSEEPENCKPVKRTRRYICNDDNDDDDADQNLMGVEGGTAPLTTQTTVLNSTEVSNTFVSESFKLQQYGDLPIDEPIWSGVFKIGNKYVPLAAHLSVKHCEKVWKISRSLQPRVEVTKLYRLEAWPRSFKASGPTDDSIALYFLPHEMRQDAELDKLVKEVMENDMVLRAVVGEAEMLIFPSILLPERHQTFKGKPYLWAVFKRREDKVVTPTLHEEQHGIGCRAQEEEKHASPRREGHQVAGLNMHGGLEAPEEAETQVTEQEQTPSSARPIAAEPAEGTACPAPTPTMPAAMPATGGQIHPCFGAPTGALFGFIAGQTPRLEQLIKEMQSEGALVVAMRTEMIGSGLGQTTAK